MCGHGLSNGAALNKKQQMAVLQNHPNAKSRRSKTKTCRELKRARTKARDHANWRPERWVYRRVPDVSRITHRVRTLASRVLDTIDRVLLKVRMVKQIERFSLESQNKLLT